MTGFSQQKQAALRHSSTDRNFRQIRVLNPLLKLCNHEPNVPSRNPLENTDTYTTNNTQPYSKKNTYTTNNTQLHSKKNTSNGRRQQYCWQSLHFLYCFIYNFDNRIEFWKQAWQQAVILSLLFSICRALEPGCTFWGLG